jgi:hypothetical protein
MDPFEAHFSHQLTVRKNRKRNLDAEEEDLFSKAQKVCKTSSELMKEVEVMERDMHSAQDVDSIWKQKMRVLENGHEQITYLLKLNDKAYDHGDNDVCSYREIVVKLCQLRKLIAE